MFKNLTGGLIMALAVVLLIAALPDVKRYIRISTM
jgi:hypothetical protein